MRDREQLDTQYLVETPESIDLQSEIAGPVPRTLAYLIDLMIRWAVSLLFLFILAFAGEAGFGIFLIIAFLLEWFYPVLFEVYRNGQTIGKSKMGLVVVNEDLTPVSWGPSLVRNLLRAADFLPFAFLAGLTSMVLSRRFQRLGDMAAGTLVIYRKKPRETVDHSDARSYPPPFPLELEDQSAIIGFTERSHELSPDRQQELADIIGEVTGRSAESRIDYLKGVGNWLLGVR